MKSKILGLFLLMASPVLAGSFYFGIGGGRPYYPYGGGYRSYYRPPIVTYVAPPPVYYSAPAYPPAYYGDSYYGDSYYGSGYGYDQYYERPPFAGAIWVAPRYYGGRHYRGYWRR